MRKTAKRVAAISATTVIALATAGGNMTIGIHAETMDNKPVIPNLVKENTSVTNEQKPKPGYTFLSGVLDVTQQGNVVTIAYVNGEKAQLTFLDNNLFRFDMEPDGKSSSFKDYATPNSANQTGRIIQQKDNSSEYNKPTPTVEKTASQITISTEKVRLEIDKTTAMMKLSNAATNTIIWEESAPLQYKAGSTIQSLKEQTNENFYGGGTQNGSFVHTGQAINIVNENEWTNGKVSSPNPFYWTTQGYGVVRNTFKPGNYDFGKSTKGEVVTKHNENRFDAYFIVGDNPQDILNGYFKLTGNPALLPMKSFYLGHLNCYNRDEWKPSGSQTSGSKLEDGNRYNEKNNHGVAESGWTLESLNGNSNKEDPAYKFSARAVIDGHVDNDMPFGWFIPNDGYGCGYGQDNTSLDTNVDNLKSFTDYAKEYGIGTGLWTQSALTPDPKEPIKLQRDFEKEVKVGGIRTLKTDVAWVGQGYSFGLDGIHKAYDVVSETKDRPTIVTLDGWAGTQRFGGIWTGDQTGGNWEYIRFHIPTYIGQSLSGNPNVSSDVDGIFGGSSLIQTRDIQWKSFTTMMLDMDGWGSNPKKPYIFGEDTTSINRMYLKLRAQLMPYIYSAAYTSANLGSGDEKGKPQIRAMFLEYPKDPNAYGNNVKYQFMMGKNLLVAPVYQNTAMKPNGDDIRNGIYLPDDKQVWIDYFTGKQYRGNQTLNNFDAPIWKLPLFVKNGAILPMYAENNNVAAITAKNKKGLDKTKRIVEFYPDATKTQTDYTLYEDDGNSIDNTNKDQPVYGNVVKTHFTSEVSNGTATLTAEKSSGSYTGYDSNRDTTFVVNASKEPTDITATIGSQTLNKADFTKVTTTAEFDSATGNTYFYDASPNLNKYATAGSSFASKEITTTPKLYVKFAKTDVNTNAVSLKVKGFANEGNLPKYELNENLGTPSNLAVDTPHVTPSSIPLTWDSVNGATGYELETDGVIQGGIAEAKYDHVNLEYHSQHAYRVRAINADGYSHWSPILNAQSALDPYRNVPKNIALKWPFGDQYGALKGALDFDYSSMFHSTNNAIGKDFIMDMKKVYNMDRFEYTPRQDNKGNGTVQQMDVYASIDGEDYKLVHEGATDPWTYSSDMNVRDTKTVDLKGVKARYLKLVVRKSIGGFFSAAEMQPYKVDGSVGLLPGDTNKDGIVDENDLTQIENYVGLEKGDPAWAQVEDMDWNNNGYIDALDIAYTTSKLKGSIPTQTKAPQGSVQFVVDKKDVKNGEKVNVKAYGVNMKNVYALGFQLPFNSADLTYTTTKPSVSTLDMKQFSSSRKRVDAATRNNATNDTNLNVVYSNLGNQKVLEGTQDLCSFVFTAKKDLTITDDIFSNAVVTYVSNGLKEINPMVSQGTPTVPSTKHILTAAEIPTITFSNDVNNHANATDLWQQADWKTLLFNGNLSDNAEFKWYYGHASDITPVVKLPTDMKFTFNKARAITSFKVYNRESGNGCVTSIKAVAHTSGNQDVDLGTIAQQKNVYEFIIPQGTGNLDSITITPLTSTGKAISGTDQTTVPTGGKDNRMLTLHEIQFIEDSTQNVNDLILDTKNPSTVNVNRIVDFSAKVTPTDASNPFYDVTSSNPDVLQVIKTSTPTGYVYALKGKQAGTAQITATSEGVNNAGNKISKTVTITVVNDIYLDHLNKQLQDAKDSIKQPQLFTTVSLKQLQDVIVLAEKVVADKNSQTAVDDAVIDLHNAMIKLEYKGSDVTKPDSTNLIPYNKMSATASSFAGESPVANAIDGDNTTFWHSNYSSGLKLPQSITIDLGKKYNVEQLDYLPRQDGAINGDVSEYRIEISEDGVNYHAVVQGTFANSGSELLHKNEFNKVKFDKTQGRYVKFIAVSSLGSPKNTFASAAEFKVYGQDSDIKPATGITLDTTTVNDMVIGTTKRIHATLTPSDSTDLLTWTSSNEAVAIVDNTGLITAVSEGTATIHVVANDTVSADIQVSVKSADKELLEGLINDATTQAGTYDNALIKAYVEAAIAEANTHVNGTQAEVKAAYQALRSKMTQAETIHQNVKAVQAFASVDLTKYETSDDAQSYKDLVQNALILVQSPIDSADDLQTAQQQLSEAFDKLVVLKLDSLKHTIDFADALDMNAYVDNEQRTSFISQLEAVKALHPTNNQQITEAIDRLHAAMKALSKKATSEQNKTLKKQYDTFFKVDITKYSAVDQKQISDTLNIAKAALQNNNLSETDAEKVINQLNALFTLKPNKPLIPTMPEVIPDTNKKPQSGSSANTYDSTSQAGWLFAIGLGGVVAMFAERKRKRIHK